MAIEVKELDGRKWSDTATGGSVRRRFRITGLAVGFAPLWNYFGLPKVGDAHPTMAGYYCATREFEEGRGKDKTTVVVNVNYEPQTMETSGSGTEQITCQVEQWGWDEGTDEKELTAGVDGTPVLNSAGDPFDSVPKVSTPAPTFTKVMKFKTRQTGWHGYMCCVNSAAVEISGKTFPIGSLLCTVSEQRIFGDKEWKYRYTVHLKYKSNPVKIEGGGALTDIGWDVAITDAGMRELDSDGGRKLIRVIDKETGKQCTVTSAALLDGQGAKLREEYEPYNFRFQAYVRDTFPEWFYSEPELADD